MEKCGRVGAEEGAGGDAGADRDCRWAGRRRSLIHPTDQGLPAENPVTIADGEMRSCGCRRRGRRRRRCRSELPMGWQKKEFNPPHGPGPARGKPGDNSGWRNAVVWVQKKGPEETPV